MASDHLSQGGQWPHRLAEVHTPFDADTEPRPSAHVANSRTRRDLPTSASPAISTTADPSSVATSDGSSASHLARGQPTADPSPAPCRHSRAPDPDVTTRRLQYGPLVALIGLGEAKPWRLPFLRAVGNLVQPAGQKTASYQDFRVSEERHEPYSQHEVPHPERLRQSATIPNALQQHSRTSRPLRTAEDITNHHPRVPMTSPATIRPLTPLERPGPDRHCTGLHPPDPPLPRSNAGSSPHERT